MKKFMVLLFMTVFLGCAPKIEHKLDVRRPYDGPPMIGEVKEIKALAPGLKSVIVKIVNSPNHMIAVTSENIALGDQVQVESIRYTDGEHVEIILVASKK